MQSQPGASHHGYWRAAVVALGALYVVLGVLTVTAPTSHDESVEAVLVVAGLISGSGAVVFAGGYRLPTSDVDPQFYRTVFARCLAGIGTILGVLAVYHFTPGGSITDPQTSVPILTGLASVAGLAVGYSDGRTKTREAALERQNRQLERIRNELKESNERLEQFAYAASHDLQEPLRMVSSYLKLIEGRYGDALDEEGEEFIEFALDGAERMTVMIDGLLAYSRIESQGTPFDPVDLDDVLADVCTDLELRIGESDATIDVDDLPTVEGDESQLRQLFQNLISNAIEYTDETPPRIEVTAASAGDEWLVSVRDDGIGIERADQERIFEVFQRLHTQDEHVGTGLGLATCKRIVERHDGTITVDSEPGEGATFTVALPASADEPSPRPIPDESLTGK